MASRMDRYDKKELIESGRSTKNKSLYRRIEDLETYTNIEGVATIEKTNEIDITKVQNMLKNRENYKKQRQLSSFIPTETKKIQLEQEIEEEPKNYNINDLLKKVNEEKITNNSYDSYRKLDDNQIQLLKDLNSKNIKDKKENISHDEELKELINTLSNSKSLNELAKTINDVGLLDELKSDTMVGDASSIKKIIDEEKEKTIDDNQEIDKSFYTSSFGFTSSDFEELKNMNHNIKKSNKFIIILLVILIILVIVAGVYFLLQ